MSNDAVDQDEDRATGLVSVVRAVIASRVRDPDLRDDLVQETLARVIANRSRLDDSALRPYAIVTARNLVASTVRSQDRRQRHLHRLLDLREPTGPETAAIEAEDRRSVAAALDRLSSRDRQMLVAHEVHDVGTARLADAHGSTPGAIAVRLAAARAKLRVEYVLSLRGVEPPTSKCRPVLTAISSGDRRRQRALAAGDHLTTCEECAELSKPLLERRRGLAGLLPLGLAKLVLDRLGRRVRQHPAQTATVVVLAAGVIVGAVAIAQDSPEVAPPAPVVATEPANGADSSPNPPPENPGPVSVDGQPLLPLPPLDDLGGFVGRPVDVRSAAVESVPADEGFWIGDTPEQRLWVQLLGAAESPFTVRPGQRLSFQGVLVAHEPGMAGQSGVDPAEGAAQLDQQGHHIEIEASAITLG